MTRSLSNLTMFAIVIMVLIQLWVHTDLIDTPTVNCLRYLRNVKQFIVRELLP